MHAIMIGRDRISEFSIGYNHPQILLATANACVPTNDIGAAPPMDLMLVVNSARCFKKPAFNTVVGCWKAA